LVSLEADATTSFSPGSRSILRDIGSNGISDHKDNAVELNATNFDSVFQDTPAKSVCLQDMVAFSCCVFDGGNQEKQDMIAARERGWKGKFTKPGRVIRPGAIRLNGKCPLTPLEVGLMLRGMGFNKSTYIYLASGPIYGANRTMAPLLEMFPNLQTKEMLASEEELAPFKNFSSRMAALDYTVCLHSEVFVTTQGGNFPHFLMGHRRYLFGGHSKTIRPDKRKLAVLFDNPKLGWRSFKHQMLNMRSHSDSKGFKLKRASDSIYIFPCPDCMCRKNKTTATTT
ncbi:hypothetical protein F2Q70_00041676, partial [Brassica cretica]